MEPSKTNQTKWELNHNTFILYIVPYLQTTILLYYIHRTPFCQLYTPPLYTGHVAYSHSTNRYSTSFHPIISQHNLSITDQHCLLHSLLHTSSANFTTYIPCTACYTDCMLLMHSTSPPPYLLHIFSSSEVVVIYTITHNNMHYTELLTHSFLHARQPLAPVHSNNKHKACWQYVRKNSTLQKHMDYFNHNLGCLSCISVTKD